MGKDEDFREILFDELSNFKVHEKTGTLYWGDQLVITKKRFDLTTSQTALAGLVAILTAAGIFLAGLSPFLEFLQSFCKQW